MSPFATTFQFACERRVAPLRNAFWSGPEHRAPGRVGARAGRERGVVAGLLVAVLAIVRDHQLDVPAEPQRAVEAVAVRARVRHRLVLEPGPVGGRLARREACDRGALVAVAPVVVDDLVVVPHDDPRVARLELAQVGVAAVEAVLLRGSRRAATSCRRRSTRSGRRDRRARTCRRTRRCSRPGRPRGRGPRSPARGATRSSRRCSAGRSRSRSGSGRRCRPAAACGSGRPRTRPCACGSGSSTRAPASARRRAAWRCGRSPPRRSRSRSRRPCGSRRRRRPPSRAVPIPSTSSSRVQSWMPLRRGIPAATPWRNAPPRASGGFLRAQPGTAPQPSATPATATPRPPATSAARRVRRGSLIASRLCPYVQTPGSAASALEPITRGSSRTPRTRRSRAS